MRPPQNPPGLLVRWLESHPGGPSLALMAAAIKAVDRMKSDGAAPDELLEDLRARLHGAVR